MSTARGSVGRPNKYRVEIARAFVAKAVLNLGTTNKLIERLTLDLSLKRICGFPLTKRIPDKTVFSRAFAEFSKYYLPEKVHAILIKKRISGTQFDTVSHDSTAIEAREKPIKLETYTGLDNSTKRKRGRPKKDDYPLPQKELSVIEMQQTQSFEEMLAQLPRHCNVGTKKNSKGYKETWHGYKLHLSTIKGDIPVSCILTSASIHDSQVMIPLIRKTTAQIDYLYDLADAVYCSDVLRTESYLLGHKALIDHNPRRG